jgi:ACR3 family arsenite transporter
MRDVFADTHLLVLTLFLNWVVGPFLMYFLAIAFFNQMEYASFMSGLSLVGCARCIAMVIVWVELARGDREYCAAIVALNSIVTIFLYSPYAVLFLISLPQAMLGRSGVDNVDVTMGDIAASVGIYLGVPLAAGVLCWFVLTRAKGKEWYYDSFCPRIGPLTLAALLFTVVVLFASQSKSITHQVARVLYAAVPLAIYFLVMFISSFYMAYWANATYAQATTLAFTAASNNFELALAVAVGK